MSFCLNKKKKKIFSITYVVLKLYDFHFIFETQIKIFFKKPRFMTCLKRSYDAILMIIILCICCNRICWHALMLKKTHYFSNTVHYCRSSMSWLCFLQSPSFRQAQSALIGQLTQSIVIGRTPQAVSEMKRPFP